MTDCDIQAFKSLKIETTHLEDKLSLLAIVTEENYDEAQRNLAADFPEYFSGSYSDFAVRWKRLASERRYTRNIDFARSILTSGLTPTDLEAYKACVRGRNGGAAIFIDIVSNERDQAQVLISWEPAQDTLGRLFNMDVSVYGGSYEKPIFDKAGFTGTLPLTIKRDNPLAAIHVEVRGQLEKGPSRAGTAHIPAPIPPRDTFPRTDVGLANDLYFPVPVNTQRDRNIEIEAHYLVHYESPGDPSHRMTITINDEKPITKIMPTRGDSEHRISNDMCYLTTRVVKAGEQLKIKLHVDNTHTRSEKLYLDVREI